MDAVIRNANKHFITIDEWQKFGEFGLFQHFELIEGEIIEMAPIGFKHSGHLNRLNALFNFLTYNRAIVSVQNPVQLGRFSEPEPDLMLLKPNADFYSSRHPQADDVLLLVEVSDSTLLFDQTEKMQFYAKHKIPEYWILNLQASCLEVYRQPCLRGYKEKHELDIGETISLLAFEDLCVNVKDLF